MRADGSVTAAAVDFAEDELGPQEKAGMFMSTKTGNQLTGSEACAPGAVSYFFSHFRLHQAGYISQVFWLWMEPLMDLGSKRPLVYSDMHALPSRVCARTTASNFDAAWAQERCVYATACPVVLFYCDLFS